jgi:hypothetical protein
MTSFTPFSTDVHGVDDLIGVSRWDGFLACRTYAFEGTIRVGVQAFGSLYFVIGMFVASVSVQMRYPSHFGPMESSPCDPTVHFNRFDETLMLYQYDWLQGPL